MPAQKAWIQERIESIHNITEFSEAGKRAILERLTAAETFERFLDKKYTGTKRFGLDGGESAIPALEQILKRGGQLGLEVHDISQTFTDIRALKDMNMCQTCQYISLQTKVMAKK